VEPRETAYFDAAGFSNAGTLINGARGSTGALIESREIGVYGGGAGRVMSPNAPVTIVNFGTIEALGTVAPAREAIGLASGAR